MRTSMKIVMGTLSVLGLCALLIVAPPVADAAKPDVNVAGGGVAAVKLDPVGSWSGGNAADLSVGWEFETTDRVQVTELGVWNRGGGPLDADVPVAIWDDAGDVVVATRIPAGDESHALDEFRYTPIEPVELVPGKRYVIASLSRRGTQVGEVIGNGASMTTAGPIRWVKPRRAQTQGLALPAARAEDGIGVGSFGPNFLMARSDATRKRGTYYRSRDLGWPLKHSVAAVPEKPDGSHSLPSLSAKSVMVRTFSSDDYAYVFHWYHHGGANNCTASKNFVYVRCVHDPIPGWE